jgi:hypothetical protein
VSAVEHELDGQADELGPVVERGRYTVYEHESGLVLVRAVDTCEECRHHGCGDQAEPMPLPDPRRGRVHLMAWFAANANKGLMRALSGVMSGD